MRLHFGQSLAVVGRVDLAAPFPGHQPIDGRKADDPQRKAGRPPRSGSSQRARRPENQPLIVLPLRSDGAVAGHCEGGHCLGTTPAGQDQQTRLGQHSAQTTASCTGRSLAPPARVVEAANFRSSRSLPRAELLPISAKSTAPAIAGCLPSRRSTTSHGGHGLRGDSRPVDGRLRSETRSRKLRDAADEDQPAGQADAFGGIMLLEFSGQPSSALAASTASGGDSGEAAAPFAWRACCWPACWTAWPPRGGGRDRESARTAATAGNRATKPRGRSLSTSCPTTRRQKSKRSCKTRACFAACRCK